MGTCNTGIFQNDIALDVMEEYLNYLKDGCSDSDADRKIIENNLDIINQGGNDACEFWLALAMIEWKYGRLQVSTKNNALKMALDPQYLKIWKDEEKLYNKRISVLNEFVNQIQNIQPTKKKVKVNIPFKCVWKLGDIFAYQLVSKKSEDFGVFNKYLIFQKVGESEVYSKKIIPIIRVSKRIYDDIPNVEDYLSSSKMIWFGSPKEYEKNKLIIYSDTFLYDKKMYVESLKSYPKNIIYLGNSLPIKKEYKEGKIIGENYSKWKEFEESFFEFYELWTNVDETKYI